jgi:ABC-type nitrate/sulfonate/bicarbonate transport system substrate-binding protein
MLPRLRAFAAWTKDFFTTKCFISLRSPAQDEKAAVVMPVWIAGIQARKDASGDIHVDLDSGPPCWNDGTEARCFKLSETTFSDIFKEGHEDRIEERVSNPKRNILFLRALRVLRGDLHLSFLVVALRRCICLLLFGVMLSSVWPAHVSAATARPLRVAYLSNSATMASLWMAKETGAIAKEGIDVEVLTIAANLAIPALIAGELDAIQISAAPVLTASLRGYDVVFVAGLLNTMIWNFYSRPEISNAEGLKGKVIGTDRPATPIAYGTLVSLKKMGLSPKDVQLFPIGSSAQVLAALYAGKVMGGIASPPASFQLEKLGYHSLTSLLDVPYQNVGIVIRRSRFDELKDRLVPLLRALRAGIDRYYGDKSFAIKVISKYNRETDPEALDKSYEFYRRAGFRRELLISEPGVQGILDFLSETIPEAKKAKPSQFFDDRLVKQVDSSK